MRVVQKNSRSFYRGVSALGAGAALSLVLAGCAGGGETGADPAGDTADDSEKFPTSQIELIVPWAAGGGTDATSRQLAAAAEDTCGVRIIISNQTGAGGATGHQAIASADPDGYTIGTATVEVSILKHLGVTEVSTEDLEGIYGFSANPAVLAVSADSPYKTFDDLKKALADGETVRAAVNGKGAIWDIAARGLAKELGTEFTEYVPFDGSAGMIPAVLGGDVEVLTPSGAEMLAQIQSGNLRGLAAMSDERLPVLPDVPTLKELGVDWVTSNWFGIVAPNGVPEDRIQKLSDCFREAATTEEFQSFMEKQGYGILDMDAAEWETYMDEEFKRNEQLVTDLY